MKRIVAALLLFGVGFSVSAKTTSVECNQCSDLETRQLAIDGGTGDYFFFDMKNRKLTHWAINLNSGRAVISKVPLSSDQQRIYAATQNFYDTVGSLTAYGQQSVSPNAVRATSIRLGVQTAGSEVGPMSLNGKVTAFDVVEMPLAKQAAINAVTDFSFDGFANVVRIGVATVMNAFTNNVLINVPINVFNRVILPDGSTFIVKWNFQTMQYDYVNGSAKDGVGNPIAEDATAAAGGLNSTQRYSFPNTPAGQMAGVAQVQHLNNLGIDVKVVTRGSTWIVSCVSNAGRTTCTAQP